jgi:CHASE3 domain sensor protein
VQVQGADALLHSESIARPELGDTLRELLWKRLQVIIHNHALERLWTQINVPYWRDQGFEPASVEQLQAVPAAFPQDVRAWNVKVLRAADATAAMEREFARLRLLQQEENDRMKSRVQWMKRAAFVITVIVFLLVVVWAITMLKVGPKLFQGVNR